MIARLLCRYGDNNATPGQNILVDFPLRLLASPPLSTLMSVSLIFNRLGEHFVEISWARIVNEVSLKQLTRWSTAMSSSNGIFATVASTPSPTPNYRYHTGNVDIQRDHRQCNIGRKLAKPLLKTAAVGPVKLSRRSTAASCLSVSAYSAAAE